MRRSAPRRRDKPNKPARRHRDEVNLDHLAMQAARIADHLGWETFKVTALHQRRCQNPLCRKPLAKPWHAHHVVYEQELRRLGLPVWDPDNALRLCSDCHERHHKRFEPVPLCALLDVNLEYAFRQLGVRAYGYLKRRYPGEDPRIEVLLKRYEPEPAQL